MLGSDAAQEVLVQEAPGVLVVACGLWQMAHLGIEGRSCLGRFYVSMKFGRNARWFLVPARIR